MGLREHFSVQWQQALTHNVILLWPRGLTAMFKVLFIWACIYPAVSIDLSVGDGPVNTEISVKVYPKRWPLHGSDLSPTTASDKANHNIYTSMLQCNKCIENSSKFTVTTRERKTDKETSFQRDLGCCDALRAAGCGKNAEKKSCETPTWATAMNNLTGSQRRALLCPNEACCDKLDETPHHTLRCSMFCLTFWRWIRWAQHKNVYSPKPEKMKIIFRWTYWLGNGNTVFYLYSCHRLVCSSKYTKTQSRQLLVTSKQNKPKALFMQDVPFTEVTFSFENSSR